MLPTVRSIEFDPRPALGLHQSVDYQTPFCATALAFSAPRGLDSSFL